MHPDDSTFLLESSTGQMDGLQCHAIVAIQYWWKNNLAKIWVICAVIHSRVIREKCENTALYGDAKEKELFSWQNLEK